MSAPYKAKGIANALLMLAQREGQSVDPMKLQKLIYFANGYYTAETDGHPLIDEHLEAWDYGPVAPSVYYEFREYGHRPVRRYAYTWDRSRREHVIATPPIGDTLAEGIVSWVWNNYNQFTGPQLMRMTHKIGSPWALARHRAHNLGVRNEPLSINDTREYFRQLVN